MLHQCGADNIGVTDPADFIMLFYVVHEISDQAGLFHELFSILKPGGTALIVEPPFHVSKSGFRKTLEFARQAGFTISGGPQMMLHQTALIRKC